MIVNVWCTQDSSFLSIITYYRKHAIIMVELLAGYERQYIGRTICKTSCVACLSNFSNHSRKCNIYFQHFYGCIKITVHTALYLKYKVSQKSQTLKMGIYSNSRWLSPFFNQFFDSMYRVSQKQHQFSNFGKNQGDSF